MRCSLLAVLAIGSLVLASAPARAEDEETRKAREEVEREVQKYVQVPEGSVKVVWTGLDNTSYGITEAELDLDGQAFKIKPVSDLAAHADRTLFEGTLAEGTHHVHVMLLVRLSDLSLLGGYRVTEYRIRGDVPFPAARGLSVPVRIGLHIDPAADDPQKKMKIAADVKPVMLAAVDDSVPPPPAPPVTQVATAEVVPPPPLVPATDATAALAEVKPAEDAGPSSAAKRPATAHPDARPGIRATPPVDAGAPPPPVDAGPPEVDAGPTAIDAGPPVLDAGLPPAPTRVAAAPAPAPLEADDSDTKRLVAGVLGLLLLIGSVIALRRRRP